MARIRIVDEWLRSPVSAPCRHRAVLVVADSWSEQRVLMRAFAGSGDQTRPTIRLHGAELAIGPAGVEPHGPWGVHVEPPVDGRAQELRDQLEVAARRLAGSRARAPRLEDESPAFDRQATSFWLPSTPPAPDAIRHEPAEAMASGFNPGRQPAPRRRRTRRPTRPLFPLGPSSRRPQPVRGAAAATRVVAPASEGAAGHVTRLEVPAPARAAPAARRPAPTPQRPAKPLSALVGHTMPLGFGLAAEERRVLNAVGERGSITADEVAEIAGIADGAAWMDALVHKLAEHGLDLLVPDRRGEVVAYVLRR